MSTWSGIRAKLEKDYLAQSLRGRIQYFATSYSKCPDHEGRAAVRLDGVEVLKSSYYEYWMAETRVRLELYDHYPDSEEEWEQVLKEVINGGDFDQRDFYNSFNEFDNQSIEKSLSSDNSLVRMFAILDRRVGKRRLRALKEEMSHELEWLQFFYDIRLKAEGLYPAAEEL